ncbi:MAG: 50S ribosomal protein L6 [Chlamydiota bacterium]
MSRLGKSPISLPKGVDVKIADGQIKVTGPKGTLTFPAAEGININIEDGKLVVVADSNVEMPRTQHGLYRATINNMVIGVSKGFEKKLAMVGVGYRAAVQGNLLDLQLGFSHPTKIAIPKDVQVAVDKSVTISITGINKQIVGQFAASVRAMRPPEPYKGKGIRYEGERVRHKATKASKGK